METLLFVSHFFLKYTPWRSRTHLSLCVFRYMGFTGIVGHEFVGVVEEVRPSQNEEECGSPLLVGKRVVGEINLGVCVCFRLIYFGDSLSDQGETCATLCSVSRGLRLFIALFCPTRTNRGHTGRGKHRVTVTNSDRKMRAVYRCRHRHRYQITIAAAACWAKGRIIVHFPCCCVA